ncbi:hypothetical protein GCM10023091_19140 [Ravibacter arvi]|uniref:Capsule assembly protein Wzi n=1 Tax=Ravibacter arvi TaxID=2051041 RepID=A0ABP8LXB6_9BACT
MTTHRFLVFLLFWALTGKGYSQVIVKDTLPPAFEWSMHLVDVPYMADAARAEAIRSAGGNVPFSGTIKARDYGKFYRNLSMTQATDMARNLHGSLYYGHNVLWNTLVKPVNTKKYILNRLLANIAALGTDYLAIKLPYGYAFQHEEFHRSVMASRHIYSYDEVWSFGKGLDIAVTRVKDEDLVYLKKNFPADQVRLAAAGVEGEYRFLQRMQEDNFFRQTAHPMVGISLLGTIHAVNYVNLPFTSRFNAITDSILSYDKTNILARDFTGYDFSAWIYDLVRPHEPYEARGEWPGGIGIKRPVKESDLTGEMKDFLKETGRMQYLNFVSPFLLGINRLQFRPGQYFNFALRSLPTSFGYYAGGDFFLEMRERRVMVGLGVNRSKKLTLPALNFHCYDLVKPEVSRWQAHAQLSLWMQPEDQMWSSGRATPGLALSIQPRYALTSRLSVMTDLSYKTKGWVFGDPYLDRRISGRIGLSLRTK